MLDFFKRRKINKTKKEHLCFGCEDRIPIGSSADYNICSFDRQFHTYYLCYDCVDFYNSLPQNYVEDGFCQGDFKIAKQKEGWLHV